MDRAPAIETSSSTSTSQAHDARVAAVAAQVKALAASGARASIEKGGVHHVVPLPGDRRFAARKVDASTLNHILAIDPVARTCTAEPGVTFAEIVRATLAHGLLPKVVPELEGITLGGAVAGCSVESMSFRYGGFHDTCRQYEIVAGTGEVLRVSPAREPELFHMIHGSYGGLAILTELTFELVPAKPWVHVTYETHPSFEAFEAALRAHCAAGDVDFVDAIVHGPRAFVLCLGRFVDRPKGRVSSYRALDIYWKSTARLREDTLATADYGFRYDTDCHWLTRTVPPLEWKPVRFAVGKTFLGSTNLIRWSRRLEPLLALKKRPDVVVDVFIPARRLGDFVRWYEGSLAFYPLWLVPYRLPAPYPWIADAHAARMQDDLFIDCAVYGKPNGAANVDWSEALEEKTFELGGIKTLISRNHYTRERFWEIYDRPRWEAAKRRLDPRGVFRDPYDKLCAR